MQVITPLTIEELHVETILLVTTACSVVIICYSTQSQVALDKQFAVARFDLNTQYSAIVASKNIRFMNFSHLSVSTTIPYSTVNGHKDIDGGLSLNAISVNEPHRAIYQCSLLVALYYYYRLSPCASEEYPLCLIVILFRLLNKGLLSLRRKWGEI